MVSCPIDRGGIDVKAVSHLVLSWVANMRNSDTPTYWYFIYYLGRLGERLFPLHNISVIKNIYNSKKWK